MFQIFNGKVTFDGLRFVVRKKGTKEQRNKERNKGRNEPTKK